MMIDVSQMFCTSERCYSMVVRDRHDESVVSFSTLVLVVVAGSDIANRRVFSFGPRNDGVFLRCTT